MMDNWRLIVTPAERGAFNMAVDEVLLAETVAGSSPPILRLYNWSPACISLGYAQKAGDIDLERLKSNGWEMVRRITGGRAILHVDELTYSVLAPLTEPRVAGTVLESYQRLAGALMKAIRDLEIPVEMVEEIDRQHFTNGPVCFETPSAYELTVEGKKLVGSAQARRRGGFLQHGAFPLFGDLRRITTVLQGLEGEELLNAGEKVLQRATTAELVTGKKIEWQVAANSFIRAFEDVLEIKFIEDGLTHEELNKINESMDTKYDAWRWTGRF